MFSFFRDLVFVRRISSITQDGDRLRCLLRELLRGQRGQSAVEYSIFLAILISIAGGGLVWIGGSTARPFSSLAGKMTGHPPATSPTGNPSGNKVSSDTEESRFKAMYDIGDRHACIVGGFALGAGVIVLGALLLRRLRRSKQQPIPPEDDEREVPDLTERFSTKRQELLCLLSQDPSNLFKNQLTVRHLMTTETLTVSSGATRQSIEDLMRKSHVRHLLVCGPGEQLLGIVSDRDLSSKPGTTAVELMCTKLKTISPDAFISPAITLLISARISALPVVEEGRLRGILTTTDLVLALQCSLQLWLHTATMMQGDIWEQEFMQKVQSQLDASETETCCGVRGVFEALMDRGRAEKEEFACLAER
ncbi:MAG: CBS domain-containing protein [Planctomycetota bacterium]